MALSPPLLESKNIRHASCRPIINTHLYLVLLLKLKAAFNIDKHSDRKKTLATLIDAIHTIPLQQK